jgi:hypothetical protein
MLHNVIVIFPTFNDRDAWVGCLHDHVRRVYKREPWIAASLSEDDYTRVASAPGVQVFPDAILSPMAPSPAPLRRQR